MSLSLACVAVDPSQFPETLRCDLLESLRSRTINHKFHYDSPKQTQKWLALHQAYSPSRTDPQCAAIYSSSFEATVPQLPPGPVHVIGLGCGGGQKDTTLLRKLRDCRKETFYTPCDVSVSMVLVARQAALAVVPEGNCFPLVCDLATVQNLSGALESLMRHLDSRGSGHLRKAAPIRFFTFFGMIPNFEPDIILPKLARLIGPGDHLLLSANLAPGSDYDAGVQRVLHLYDNPLTRDWLMTFLLDLGIERSDGELLFAIEERPAPVRLKRITARFRFARDRAIEIDAQRFTFKLGESIQLFFSYRHTPDLVRTLLAQHGLRVLDQWIIPSEEEGVFLVANC